MTSPPLSTVSIETQPVLSLPRERGRWRGGERGRGRGGRNKREGEEEGRDRKEKEGGRGEEEREVRRRESERREGGRGTRGGGEGERTSLIVSYHGWVNISFPCAASEQWLGRWRSGGPLQMRQLQ